MKKIVKIIAFIILAGIAVGYYIFNKPHKNMIGAKAQYVVSSVDLFNEFSENEESANEKYLDKVVQVTGRVIDISNTDGHNNITLNSAGMFGIVCQLDDLTEHKRKDFVLNEEITFKCLCTGLLMDVVMVRCVEVESQVQ